MGGRAAEERGCRAGSYRPRCLAHAPSEIKHLYALIRTHPLTFGRTWPEFLCTRHSHIQTNTHSHILTQKWRKYKKKKLSLAFELAHGPGKWRNLNFDAGDGNQTKKKAPIQWILFMGWGKCPKYHVKWERGEAIRKICLKRDYSLGKLKLRKYSTGKRNNQCTSILFHLNVNKK